MVGAYSVSMIAGEDNNGVLPQVVFVDGVDDLTDFAVYLLYQTVVSIAVHAPVLRGERCSGVDVEVIVSFLLDDIGIVRILGKVRGKFRAVAYFGYFHVAVGKILAACIFANVMRIVIRGHEEERLVVLA